MPSDFIRGIKMGAGCLVGAGALLLLLLFGMAMCAGHFEERMLEELKEQLEEWQPRERPDTDSVSGCIPLSSHPQAQGGIPCLKNIHSYTP